MMRRAFVIAVVAVFLAAQAVAQQGSRTTGSLLGDARKIITSNKGDVRLWGHAPRVVVITRDPFVIHKLEEIRQRIEAAVTPFYGPKVFGDWKVLRHDLDFAAGHHPLKFRMGPGGPAGRQITLSLGPGSDLLADIVIAVADRQTIAVLNGLWGLSPRNARTQMEGGSTQCFYSSVSSQGRRRGAYVSIVTPRIHAETEDCLWEDLLHTLGPLSTLKGSPYFSFDHKILSTKTRRANDLALIRALYESVARPGDAPDAVILHLKKLLDNRQ